MALRPSHLSTVFTQSPSKPIAQVSQVSHPLPCCSCLATTSLHASFHGSTHGSSHASSFRAPSTSSCKSLPASLCATWSGETSQRHVIREAGVPRNRAPARRVNRPTWRAHATPSSSSSSSSSSSPTPSSSSPSSSAPLSLQESDGESNDDVSSPRSIAAGLHRRYRAVVDSGYRDHLNEFARAAVAAYAVGCTEEGLRRELTALLSVQPPGPRSTAAPTAGAAAGIFETATGTEAAAVTDTAALTEAAAVTDTAALTEAAARAAEETDLSLSPLSFASSVPAAAVLSAESRHEVRECVLWVAIVFVTIAVLPQPVVTRWAMSKAASPDSLVHWKGFCSLIANAYYTQGMAWYSVGRLQMEQMAVAGVAEPAAVVADRMRLVFTTLEVVDPRWGGLQDFPTL